MLEVLVLASLAVVLAVGAVLLWRHADRSARRAASSAFLESQLQRGRDEAAGGAPFAEGAREFRAVRVNDGNAETADHRMTEGRGQSHEGEERKAKDQD